jgi:hypothetical protein
MTDVLKDRHILLITAVIQQVNKDKFETKVFVTLVFL